MARTLWCRARWTVVDAEHSAAVRGGRTGAIPRGGDRGRRGGAGTGGAWQWQARRDGAWMRMPDHQQVASAAAYNVGSGRLARRVPRRCRRARHQNSNFGREDALLLFTSAMSIAAWEAGTSRARDWGRCYGNKLEKKETRSQATFQKSTQSRNNTSNMI
jgi:hypothetical protein